MASGEMKRDVTIFFATLVIVMSYTQIKVVNGDPQVPCFFIFGDSLSDNGNNNDRSTKAKANYQPYGIDFPGGVATGRFTNGLTVADCLAQLLEFNEFVPPFATTFLRVILEGFSQAVLKGVNYASGASGIRDETGRQLGSVLSMDKQLINHQKIVDLIRIFLGSRQSADELLNKCIYYSGMGNNDYINNYFMPESYSTSRQFTPQQYAQVLIDQYRGQIEKLYDLGARKVVLVGNGLIGCTPYAISKFGTNGSACVDNLNIASQLFNDKLVGLVDKLNTYYFPKAQFIYINSTGIGSGDPTAAGFTVFNRPCCPVDKYGQCVRSSTPCPNRREYVFYDNFHPTTAVNNFTCLRSYFNFLPSDTYPMNIKSLAEQQL